MKMSIKFDIEKYDGKMSFVLWQMQMAGILSSLRINDTMHGRDKLVEAVIDKKWIDMDDKTLSTI